MGFTILGVCVYDGVHKGLNPKASHMQDKCLPLRYMSSLFFYSYFWRVKTLKQSTVDFRDIPGDTWPMSVPRMQHCTGPATCGTLTAVTSVDNSGSM